ncbi:MAG: T9SS type A sorting domain-containing protein, partial [Bacteroidaceae bacterium]|nr:T9SS type A sorting domain-containing protein [Bacteroidaceae bacterium]
AKISLDSYTVRISGAKSGQTVFVTDASGKTLSTYETDQDGSVTFSIADLPQGIYIIKSESLTCKILKQ